MKEINGEIMKYKCNMLRISEKYYANLYVFKIKIPLKITLVYTNNILETNEITFVFQKSKMGESFIANF